MNRILIRGLTTWVVSVTIVGWISGSTAYTHAQAQTEPSADNPMADEIFGDLPPAEPLPGEKGANEPVPAPAKKASKMGSPTEEPIVEAPTMPSEEPPVVDLTPMKNPAFDRLDAFKMTRAELAAFMKSGGLKSRVMKEAK